MKSCKSRLVEEKLSSLGYQPVKRRCDLRLDLSAFISTDWNCLLCVPKLESAARDSQFVVSGGAVELWFCADVGLQESGERGQMFPDKMDVLHGYWKN